MITNQCLYPNFFPVSQNFSIKNLSESLTNRIRTTSENTILLNVSSSSNTKGIDSQAVNSLRSLSFSMFETYLTGGTPFSSLQNAKIAGWLGEILYFVKQSYSSHTEKEASRDFRATFQKLLYSGVSTHPMKTIIDQLSSLL